MKRIRTVLGVALLAASLFYLQPLSAADTDFPIYFENSTLALKSQTIDKTTYLPLLDIVKHLGLAYTDATVAMTFTIQGQNSRLILTPGSAFISLNERAVLLQNPIRREGGQWLVPLDFLSQGLSRISGIEFRYRPGDPRMFAGNVTPAELVMNAQSLGPTTRLTLRTGTPVEVELQRDAAQHRVVLLLKGKPIDPGLERLNYKDRLLSSIAFEDADGVARIVIGTTDEVRDVKITAAEENRVFFADFIRETVTEAVPPTAPPPAAAAVATPDALPANTSLRVIVIDPGHGGSDAGAANTATLEKDLTLALARRLRTALQSRLGASVALTRDSDVLLTSEARAQIANNNQAGLFVSLHVGYSPNKADPGSSIYIMKPDFAAGPPLSPGTAPTTGVRLFLPWYMAYRTSQQASQVLASQLQQDLNQTLPGWKFPLRSGPIGVLASVTMPAVAIELGNLNNDVSAQTLVDPVFQMKVAATMAAAIEKFTETRGGTGGRGQ
jgi:N-acetylmuramoyl-L-alanine amidase